MNTYHVSYDLKAPGRDYSKLYEVLRGFDTCCHPLDSTWYIRTGYTALQVRDLLTAKMDDNDKVLVTKASTDGAWRGLADDVSNWLKKYL